MIKQITLLLLSGSIFCQDLLTLKNDQEYRGTFDRLELEKVYFILEGKEVAQSVPINMVSLLKQGSMTLVKDGHLTLNIQDEESSYVINGVKYVKASDDEVRNIASRIINSSVHHNFTMGNDRDSFLEESSGYDIGIDERSIIFAEQLGELAAYRSIERHQFHMSSFRRLVTNYAVTMPVVPILMNLSPPLILTYPFIFPKIYDRYNQKTYFDKKMKNYLAGLPENEHEVFKSKHDPIVENYKSQNGYKIKKKDSQYSLVQTGTIAAAGCVLLVAVIGEFLSSITLG
tara:strand:- start:676 stop:1536 length:861 start_codon:yes stop_codon:yes gene_type:complete